MNDALSTIEKREVRFRTDRLDVVVERLHLRARDRIANAARPILRRRVVIGRCNDRLRTPRLASGEAQSFEGLRTRHLVNQMSIDIKQRRAVRFLSDDVTVEKLVVERL